MRTVVTTKGVSSLKESLESLNSLDSLESLESARFSFVFRTLRISGLARISKFSILSREGTFLKRPLFQKLPLDPDYEGGIL